MALSKFGSSMKFFSNYFRRTGFSRQLTVIITVAILVLALFSSIMNSWQASHRMRAYFVVQGQQVAENLARQSRLALLYHSADNAREVVATTLAFPDVLQVEIANAEHKVLLSQSKPGVNLPRLQTQPGAHLSSARLENESDQDWRFSAPVFGGETEASPFEVQESKPQLLGYVHVVVGKTTLDKLVMSLLFGNLGITLSFALILLAVIRLMSRQMIRPLNQLSSLMGRAEAGESGMRATPDGSKDIIEMAHAFNQMMAVLEERESELKQSRDQALHTAIMKAQFAATVSHEVRTPLNGVVGMLDMLKEMRLTKHQRECVDVAWNSSQALIELINDILDFSKMEAGKVEVEEIEFDLNKLLAEVLQLLSKQAQHKGLELAYLIADDVPLRIKSDPLRLRQILINLIGNAVKFTERGEVAIRVVLAQHADHEQADSMLKLRFDVSDTGIGMSADAVANVFESFAQADRSTTRKYGGTGLGLAICKQLVALLHGEIGVSSIPEQGSNFYFSMQCRAVASENKAENKTENTAEKTDLLSSDLQDERILIVDPSEILRHFLMQNLSRHGILCRAVPDGVQALILLDQAARDGTPHSLVILDVGSMDDNGEELARRLRNDHRYSGIRTLALDRYGSTGESNPSSADICLGKPVHMDRLLEALRHLLLTTVNLQTSTAATLPAPMQARATEVARHPGHGNQGEWRVLVVEDNRTNQMVAAGMLSLSSCHCEFAGNGKEAVEAARRNRYDLILMDCSMPEMDGYEATVRIRSYEDGLGRRTPIVAMTANTQRGDAEKCLAIGMDDYLAKPITLVELRQKLERWLTHGGAAGRAVPADGHLQALDSHPLDRAVFDKLRDILGPGLQQTVSLFLEDTPVYLEQLNQGLQQGDAEVVRAMAHSIKGSSGNLGATNLLQFAKEVEQLALERHLAEIPPLLNSLHQAYEAVATELGNEIFLEDHEAVSHSRQVAKVLVVDDDRSTRSTLRHTLQRDGFKVEEAADGSQALLMLKRMRPDVILMDAVMPVMDGFTACSLIQEMPRGRSIPVLMITALEDNSSVERAFAAGACDYIPKPIHFAVLSQRVRRIIEANQAEKRIRHLAFNDVLTGLPNRTQFLDQLGRRLALAKENVEAVAVLFLDLDRFKNVNDTLGHDVGDRLLIAVAQRIRRSVRNADCVARLGGDEFTVVLSELADPAAAASAAQNICRTLAKPFQIDSHDIFVTASIGISVYPNDGTDVGTLVKHADTAMYRAKKTNTDFQFFEAAMEHSISERVRLENDLRRALERNELAVFYQPQARMDNGEIIGMEALVRWFHPTRGMVSPLEFIPMAEETGLIIALGEWVLRTACAQMRNWKDKGLGHLRVAVNLSVSQLLEKDFASTVEQVLIDTGLPAKMLELEITESTLMEHAQDTLAVLDRLRSLGVRLTIDDFGTGYSSLSYLKRFPVDIIKIDRSFVRDIPGDADDAAIVTGIIALAHSLRLEVVAEGVETREQLEFLRSKSCDILQGFYLSKPIPAQQLEDEILSQAGSVFLDQQGK
ncbi:diguanylate cyclase (GGDEF)-like protein [Undibacterium pigrum]|uniref:Virulence sensor protein BvgS n=2 Tax=Undibacterium pigrum TaxID=401470 RepID=A0A318IQA4_9BURK|nr:diguanylate cyclase (GGDEF)-like protein [Undibacterium pigrum]